MANSVDPDQTTPIGAVCSGSTLFASILISLVMLEAIICSRRLQQRTFSDAFFLGALRVKIQLMTRITLCLLGNFSLLFFACR